MNNISNKLLINSWLKGKPLEFETLSNTEIPFKSDKRVLFLEPRGAVANVFSFAMKYPLLGPLRMTTIARQNGYNAIMYNENLAKKDIPVKLLKSADILVLTLLTQTCKRGYEIADRYRELNPNGKVFIGGIHPSFNVEEGVKHCDHLVIGEGEEVIIDLINGVYDEKIVNGGRLQDLTQLAIPDLRFVFNHKRTKTAPILTSLGCPFDCSFCCVTEMYGRKYRRFSVSQTIEAIKQYKLKKAFFLDDNFCANKKWNRHLFDEMNRENVKLRYISQVRADIAKDEAFIEEMASSGCRRVFIGFESVNQASLNSVEKNATIGMYVDSIKTFHKYGIPIHGMFIFGMDSDDTHTFRDTVDFCMQNGIESAQFLMITPFPGTKYYEELDECRFITKDTDYYDGNHIIVDPKLMTRSEMYEGMLYAYSKFYSWYYILRRLFRDIKSFYKVKSLSKSYRVFKIWNNFWRSVGLKIVIFSLKLKSRKYRRELSNYPGPNYFEK